MKYLIDKLLNIRCYILKFKKKQHIMKNLILLLGLISIGLNAQQIHFFLVAE